MTEEEDEAAEMVVVTNQTTKAEVDAVQRKVFWGWGMKHKPRKQDVTDAVVLEEGSGLGLGFGN